MSNNWKYTIGGLFRLILFTYQYACVSSMSFHDLIAHFFQCWILFHYLVCYNVFIHSPTEEYLGCFQVLVVRKKAIINMHGWGFVWEISFNSFGQISRNAISTSYSKRMFSFVKYCQLSYKVTSPFYIFTTVNENCCFSSSPAFGVISA